MLKIQQSIATNTTSDTKQNYTNIQNTKQKDEITSGSSKNNVEPNITQKQKTTAEDTYLQKYQFTNEISTQNKTCNQFPVPNNTDNVSDFTTGLIVSIQQVTGP